MQKSERWYDTVEVDGVKLYGVYNNPYKSKATSCSTVRDLSYYRREFRLRKIWGEKPPDVF